MLRELLDVLQQQMESNHAMNLEWIVIWLIVVEVLLACSACCTYRHIHVYTYSYPHPTLYPHSYTHGPTKRPIYPSTHPQQQVVLQLVAIGTDFIGTYLREGGFDRQAR